MDSLVAERKSNNGDLFLIYIALAATVIIAFEQIRLNEFIRYDDFLYLTSNPHLKTGLTHSSLKWAFTANYASNWHPLTWISHIVDYELFGLNPRGHHLTNLAFHLASTLLLFWVLKRMTGALWASVFVAAIFGLHPLRVESVAWAAERKDVLSGFLWILTMAAYAFYTERTSVKRYLLVVCVFSLGLMAKPMLVTLPFVLLLLDYWPLRRFSLAPKPEENLQKSDLNQNACGIKQFGLLIAEKIPLFILVALSSIVTYFAQSGGGAVIENFSLKLRLANASVSYIRYIGKMIYPVRLAVLYPHLGNKLPIWQPILCFIILVAVTVTVICMIRRRRFLATGWLWYIGTMVPVIGVIQVGSQAMADRYTYIPSIGISIIIAWIAAEILAKWQFLKPYFAVLAGLIVVTLFMTTRHQVGYWRNSGTLYEHTLEVTENNYLMHNFYGNYLCEQGQLYEAESHIHKALQINPNLWGMWDIHKNLGLVYLRQGNLDGAIEHFNEVLKKKPDLFRVYNDLGTAYARKGNYDLAIEKFNEGLRLKPDSDELMTNLNKAIYLQNRKKNKRR